MDGFLLVLVVLGGFFYWFFLSFVPFSHTLTHTSMSTSVVSRFPNSKIRWLLFVDVRRRWPQPVGRWKKDFFKENLKFSHTKITSLVLKYFVTSEEDFFFLEAKFFSQKNPLFHRGKIFSCRKKNMGSQKTQTPLSPLLTSLGGWCWVVLSVFVWGEWCEEGGGLGSVFFCVCPHGEMGFTKRQWTEVNLSY